MLGIDISALGLAELRRLQEVASARGQHALAEQIAAELRARPARAARYGVAGPISAERPRLSLRAEPEPMPRRRRIVVALTAGAAGALVAALVWGVSVPPVRALMPVATQSPAPRATLALTSLPVAEDDPLSDPTSARPATPPPRAARPAARPARNPCYDEPTPADRLVCGYPTLAQREQRLKIAYQAALAAGADAPALQAEQAAWKDRRDGVSDRQALAELYESRIRQLDAAATLAPSEAP